MQKISQQEQFYMLTGLGDRELLLRIAAMVIQNREILMATSSAIGDLNTAVATLQSEDQLVLAFVASLEAKLAAIPTNDDSEVEAAVDEINTEVSNFKAALAQSITTPSPSQTNVPVTTAGVTPANSTPVTPTSATSGVVNSAPVATGGPAVVVEPSTTADATTATVPVVQVVPAVPAK